MNIQEKAERYAREKLGNWCHIVHSAYEISQCTNGEVSAKDYTAGHNEAMRWIPVGERLPDTFDENNDHNTVLCKMDNGMLFTGVYMEYQKKWNVFGFGVTCSIKEWREI